MTASERWPDIVVRRATLDDIAAFYASRPRPTLSAYVGIEEGEIIGIGGLAFADGRVVAFSDLCEGARRRKRSLHRVAIKVMTEARASGHRIIHAEASEPTSDRWLRRLGFEPFEGTLYVWRG